VESAFLNAEICWLRLFSSAATPGPDGGEERLLRDQAVRLLHEDVERVGGLAGERDDAVAADEPEIAGLEPEAAELVRELSCHCPPVQNNLRPFSGPSQDYRAGDLHC
jgi:hypothetical protein